MAGEAGSLLTNELFHVVPKLTLGNQRMLAKLGMMFYLGKIQIRIHRQRPFDPDCPIVFKLMRFGKLLNERLPYFVFATSIWSKKCGSGENERLKS